MNAVVAHLRSLRMHCDVLRLRAACALAAMELERVERNYREGLEAWRKNNHWHAAEIDRLRAELQQARQPAGQVAP